ncbi:MAG: ribosome small subunit-dependent GTPase A [Gammaproteobacteria bacterium]|nr:ribosome small subunit-dependent GTPase A [Gammaproteobacteria bacterium]
MDLNELGWKDFFQEQIEEQELTLLPARIYRQDVNRYHLFSTKGDLTGTLPGKLFTETTSKAELPTVGDWVLTAPADEHNPRAVIIERTLDRMSKFSRKQAGDKVVEQVVAANIDTVFIVSGLDDNFNVNRIERYLVLAWSSGANPVIVLNKADLCRDTADKIHQLEPIAMRIPIHAISAQSGEGVDLLRQYVESGQTAALLGSSGVGKSTIINALLGYERFDTGDVREADSKGRHTTSFREMCKLDAGGMIIDTPGMREIQIWTDESSLAKSFSDVEDYALLCKFSDCQHDSEPGCAVQEAIEKGNLEVTRLESLRKFQRELIHLVEKQDAGAKAEKKKERKKFARSIRDRPNKRSGA